MLRVHLQHMLTSRTTSCVHRCQVSQCECLVRAIDFHHRCVLHQSRKAGGSRDVQDAACGFILLCLSS